MATEAKKGGDAAKLKAELESRLAYLKEAAKGYEDFGAQVSQRHRRENAGRWVLMHSLSKSSSSRSFSPHPPLRPPHRVCGVA